MSDLNNKNNIDTVYSCQPRVLHFVLAGTFLKCITRNSSYTFYVSLVFYRVLYTVIIIIAYVSEPVGPAFISAPRTLAGRSYTHYLFDGFDSSITAYGYFLFHFYYYYYYYFRVPTCALDRGGRQELGYVADSCWTATATAPADRTGVVAGGGGRVRVCQHATTPPLAARGARHAGVRRGVQRAAAQRLGLLRGHFLPGGGRLARCTEKEIVAAKQVHYIILQRLPTKIILTIFYNGLIVYSAPIR